MKALTLHQPWSWAGLAWRAVPGVLPVFYIDYGWSSGMLAARDIYDREGVSYETRRICT